MHDKFLIDTNEKFCTLKIRDILCNYITPIIKANRTLVVLCIGTDRSTGDCLGPLVGEKLKFLIRDKVILYGNLGEPVHAKNLQKTVDDVKSKYINPYIIAIDACLGSLENVGKVIIEEMPIHPGSAVNKILPPVGDLSITGVVNISGSLEFMVLQNTRLYTVMTLADAISNSLYHSILKTIGGKSSLINTDFAEIPIADNL